MRYYLTNLCLQSRRMDHFRHSHVPSCCVPSWLYSRRSYFLSRRQHNVYISNLHSLTATNLITKGTHCILTLVYLPVEVVDSSLGMREPWGLDSSNSRWSFPYREWKIRKRAIRCRGIFHLNFAPVKTQEGTVSQQFSNSFGRPEDTRGHLTFMRVSIRI